MNSLLLLLTHYFFAFHVHASSFLLTSFLTSDERGISRAKCFGVNKHHDDPHDDSHDDSNPWPPSSNRPPQATTTKLDLYSEDELRSLWNIHTQISGAMLSNGATSSTPRPSTPSIHDIILQTLQEGNDSNADEVGEQFRVTYNTPIDQIRERLPNIRAIASDVDGTLLSSRHRLHPRTLQALERVTTGRQNGDLKNYFFLATGKTRQGALRSLGDLSGLGMGCYIQGLYCVDANGDVVAEQRLQREQVRAVVEWSVERGLSIFAYNGDMLATLPHSDPVHVRDVHDKYGEPVPVMFPSAPAMIHAPHGWNKILVMDDDEERVQTKWRPQFETLAAQYDAGFTQAVTTMLEFLPRDSNKATGVRDLCRALGIDPATELLAIGDGENDAEFLEMAAVGIAMGNAVAVTKSKADIVLTATNDEGGAGWAIEQFGLKKQVI